MKTKKIYYEDSYIKEFDATVISCYVKEDKFELILDKTAFYPEGGGQPSDTGTINGATLSYVHDKEGIVYHIVDELFVSGQSVRCKIDFDKRFAYMQLHSGEHIVSGIISNLYKLNNFGFHMDEFTATIDVDGDLCRSKLLNIENLANNEIYRNNDFLCVYPTLEELKNIEYRFKKELSGDIRIVYGGKADICACCGTHVNKTGEIGLIKILSSQKHRGGTRIVLTCGVPAMNLFQNLYEDITEISQMTSTKPKDILSTVKKLDKDLQDEKIKNHILQEKTTQMLITAEPYHQSFIFKVVDDIDSKTLRELALGLCAKTPSYVFLLSGEENNYKYVLASDKIDISSINNELRQKLSSRGGGKGDLCQGTISNKLEDINIFLNSLEEYNETI